MRLMSVSMPGQKTKERAKPFILMRCMSARIAGRNDSGMMIRCSKSKQSLDNGSQNYLQISSQSKKLSTFGMSLRTTSIRRCHTPGMLAAPYTARVGRISLCVGVFYVNA